MICLDFGFNNDTAIDYGYHVSLYWTGATSVEKFIGWNGDGSRNKSSNDILEEIFLLPDRQDLLLDSWFMTDSSDDYHKPDVTFRRVMFPLGRCMFISPSYDMTFSHKKSNALMATFNNSAFDQLKLSSAKLKVFLMDKATSPQLYPDLLEMEGDPINISLEPGVFVYKTEISKSEHVLDDPLFDCAVYTANHSYDDCRKTEIMELFEKELGCQPPPIAVDEEKMCNRKFEVSEERSRRIRNLFWSVALPGGKSRCKMPCTIGCSRMTQGLN